MKNLKGKDKRRKGLYRKEQFIIELPLNKEATRNPNSNAVRIIVCHSMADVRSKITGVNHGTITDSEGHCGEIRSGRVYWQ